MKKITLLMILIFSVSLVSAQQKACCKKNQEGLPKCKLEASKVSGEDGLQDAVEVDGETTKCNRGDKKCDNLSKCSKAGASKCEGGEKSWWQRVFGGKDDPDCCKKK